MGDLWVFGYGSLMWRPGFAFEERAPALLRGLHRALCIYSHIHRGTPEKPGLVLGLDRGGACRGVAFRVAAARRAETIAYLRGREQVTMVYRESVRKVRLLDRPETAIDAITYVVDRRHGQYSGLLTREEQLALVRRGEGQSGANRDYVLNTMAHLEEMGIHDARLAWIAAELILDEERGLGPGD